MTEVPGLSGARDPTQNPFAAKLARSVLRPHSYCFSNDRQ